MSYYWLASRARHRFPMRTPELIVVTAAAALAVGAAFLLLGGSAVDAGGPAAAPTPPEVAAPAPDAPPVVVPAPFEPAIPVAVADGDFREREGVDTTGWTKGVIVGDVLIAQSVRTQVRAITVLVTELRNPIDADGKVVQIKTYSQPVELTDTTPTFEIRNLEFSKYGYVITAYSPGLNSSQQTVAITEQHPYESVQLKVSPGVPYSIWLRDQDQLPVQDTKVLLVPTGEPAGRRSFEGTSDNFGSVVFENVLAGDYTVTVGHPAQPLIPPEVLTVQIAGRTYGANGQVQCQGRALTVPRGVPLVVQVRDTHLGYGLADVTVKLTATDKIKLMVLEGSTDVAGKASFPHLLPGNWQIDVFKDGYQRRSAQVAIKDGEKPPPQEFGLPMLR